MLRIHYAEAIHSVSTFKSGDFFAIKHIRMEIFNMLHVNTKDVPLGIFCFIEAVRLICALM